MPARAERARRRRRWQSSLYARAALFLILGSTSLVGAVVVLSATMVDESVERLLGERLELARTVGVLLEHRLRADMGRLAGAATAVLEAGQGADGARTALAHEYRGTVFDEGAFVLGPGGALRASVPAGFWQVEEVVDVRALAERARTRHDVVTSPLVRLGVGNRPVLVILQPLRTTTGEHLGYVGGLLAPAAANILEALTDVRGDGRADLDLVDAAGMVVASTDSRVLFQAADHDSVLTQAIQTGRNLTGQCHSCHLKGPDAPLVRNTDVLAFTPLPSLDLGIAVHQPEDEALAPAFALQRRLVGMGGAFVTLFLLFAGLSVRSVVRPITRLTLAVRAAESTDAPVELPRFGRDEVGSLAHAFQTWRKRTLASLASEKRHREALHQEIEATRRHLEALQEIAAQAMLGAEAYEILEHGLDQTLAVLGLPIGVIRIQSDGRTLLARRNLDEDEAEALLARCEHCFAEGERHDSALGFGVCAHGRMDLPPGESALPGRHLQTLLGAHHEAPKGLHISSVLADDVARDDVEERWLQSLVHHIGISVTSRILRDRELDRQQQQAQYLHRVLKAQEDERRRIARELHDTVAQDLAALRLEVERLGSRAGDDDLRHDLGLLEKHASTTLDAVRHTLLDLRLSVLENMGFLPTLQWHLERVQRDYGVRGILGVDGEERPLDYERAVTLFRIFQECIQNAVQHGQADHVFVTVDYGPHQVEMTVEDDGRGFDPAGIRGRAPEAHGRGLGILGMEERSHLLGGEFDISSRPGEGTTVTVRVPLERGGDLDPTEALP